MDINIKSAIPPLPLEHWAYFLDMDGTLIDLAETPKEVHIEHTLIEEMRRLLLLTNGAVAIVSGRTIDELSNLMKPLEIAYAGQHGLERRSSSRLRAVSDLDYQIDHIRTILTQRILSADGFLIEDKGLSIAVHYRKVPWKFDGLLQTLTDIVEQTSNDFVLISGKFVLEVVPRNTGKGDAILKFLTEIPFQGRRPVFIGDDVTDEHAFATVNELNGISIKVGAGSSCAHYRLTDVGAVRTWLKLITKE